MAAVDKQTGQINCAKNDHFLVLKLRQVKFVQRSGNLQECRPRLYQHSRGVLDNLMGIITGKILAKKLVMEK